MDVLFGNESEAETFESGFNINSTDLQQIAQQIAAMAKLSDKRQKVVVITQVCDPVILVENGKVTLIPVMVLTRDQMVDKNGAGEAFAGGSVAQMGLGNSYVTVVKCGL